MVLITNVANAQSDSLPLTIFVGGQTFLYERSITPSFGLRINTKNDLNFSIEFGSMKKLDISIAKVSPIYFGVSGAKNILTKRKTKFNIGSELLFYGYGKFKDSLVSIGRPVSPLFTQFSYAEIKYRAFGVSPYFGVEYQLNSAVFFEFRLSSTFLIKNYYYFYKSKSSGEVVALENDGYQFVTPIPNYGLFNIGLKLNYYIPANQLGKPAKMDFD